jgi:membrane protein YdbS with pleckstrin-like domain
MSGSSIPGEEVIWTGRPDWRSWPALTILGWILVPVVIGIVILLVLGVRRRSMSWKVTSRRIETESGWLSRSLDTLELWKVQDVELQQTILQRMLGVATLIVKAHDVEEPALRILGLPGSRDIYDRVMTAVMAARQQRGVLNLNP